MWARELIEEYGGALLAAVVVLLLIAWFGRGRSADVAADRPAPPEAEASGPAQRLAKEVEASKGYSLHDFVEYVVADLAAQDYPGLWRGLPTTPPFDGWVLAGDDDRRYFLDLHTRTIVAVRRGTSTIERTLPLEREAWEWVARLWLRTYSRPTWLSGE